MELRTKLDIILEQKNQIKINGETNIFWNLSKSDIINLAIDSFINQNDRFKKIFT